MTNLMPWARGPFELIEHAEELLRSGKDRDKRIAMVLYDNSIEDSITTYLNLHPSQRAGRIYQKKDVDQWLYNYHTKLDFFYDHITKTNSPILVSRQEIVWYHNHRNELYHSGKGMVPADYNLQGIRQAAIWVFSSLFDVDAEALLKTTTISPAPTSNPSSGNIKSFDKTNLTPVTNWTPLSKVVDINIIPNRLKFPDGKIAVTNAQGMKVLREVAEWLVTNKKLPRPPIEDFFVYENAGRYRLLINTEPIVVNKDGSNRDNKLSNGWYLNTQHTTLGAISNAIWLLQQAGENPENYYFQ